MNTSARAVVCGVDTHSRFHAVVVVDSATGRRLGHCEFAASPAGYSELTAWARSFGEVEHYGVEGTGAYGAGLCAHLAQMNSSIIEVDRPNRQARRRDGKTDALDAENAARAVLSGQASGAPKARNGAAEALRILEVTCRSAIEDRTRAINQFKALLVTAPAGLRASMQADSDARQLERARRFRTTGAVTSEVLRSGRMTTVRRVERPFCALAQRAPTRPQQRAG